MSAATGAAGRALLLENIHPSAVEVLERAGYEVHQHPASMSEAELITALPGVTLLGIRSNTSVTSAVIEAAPDLQALGCFCIGTNQVDLAAAATAGIPVFNAPYSNSRSVVELVIGEIIALARRLTEKTQRMHEGIWDKSAKGSHEVRGRTLGIVGYGNIGTQLGTVAESLGMRVVFFDVADRPAHGTVRRLATLEELLNLSDVVSIHVDGRPGNAGMFGDAEFRQMRDGAVFINASRGMVVDDVALREHLLSGHLAGAALDVFPIEPKAQGDEFVSALRGLDNVILTPHVGASTQEAQEEIGEFVAGKLAGFVTDGNTGLCVNLPNAQAPRGDGCRLAVLHDNIPGVLAGMTQLLLGAGLNVSGQVVATRDHLGYGLTDLGERPAGEVIEKIAALDGARVVRLVG
ncbi:phosphoglycerate dehydrogenase [Nocardioides sp. NPDC057577]|uniref:phosphoglycerate dehydrogenase n=1 Tax=Nocardioides sp. NPDC057577 TaxID=3346171 RepID=UPI00366E258B